MISTVRQSAKLEEYTDSSEQVGFAGIAGEVSRLHPTTTTTPTTRPELPQLL